MRTIWLIFILCFYSSCIIKDNKICAANYIGRFKISIEEVIDSAQKKLIYEKGWDRVSLISDSTGIYHFDTNDSILKSAEGTWYVTSTGYEGGCMGVIRQKNLSGEVSVNAFSISVQVTPGEYINLPFRKVME